MRRLCHHFASAWVDAGRAEEAMPLGQWFDALPSINGSPFTSVDEECLFLRV